MELQSLGQAGGQWGSDGGAHRAGALTQQQGKRPETTVGENSCYFPLEMI